MADKLQQIYPKDKFNEKNLNNIKERTVEIMNVLSKKNKMKNDDINSEELYEEFLEKKRLFQKDFVSPDHMKKSIKLSSLTNKTRNHNSLHSLSKNTFLETSKQILNDFSHVKIEENSLESKSELNFRQSFNLKRRKIIFYICKILKTLSI